MTEADFEEYIRKDGPLIYNTVFCILGNTHDTEDAVQETFLRAFISLAGYRGESSFATWVYHIAMNVIREQFKKKARHPVIPVGNDVLDKSSSAFLSNANNENGIEETLQRKEMSQTLQKALLDMPVNYRAVLVLKEVEGMSYKEISEALDEDINKVGVWLLRARDILKVKMSGYLQNGR